MNWNVKGRILSVDGYNLSWAGECPWIEDSLAFGSEEGRLHILPGVKSDQVYSLAATSEAVNGVAFSGRHVAVTSRNEVFVGTAEDSSDPRRLRTHYFNAGAIGVVVSSSGSFIAPMGGDGFYLLKPGPGGDFKGLIASSPEHPLVFQKIVRLADTAAGEVFVSASREEGLVAVTLHEGELTGPFLGRSLPGLDIVDVCALRDPRLPLAAAGVSRKGAVVFSRDATSDDRPQIVHFAELRGTAYAVLSAKGHLLLLTDHALYVFKDLASRLLAGEYPVKDVAVSTLVCDGSDVYSLREDAILIPEEGKVLRFEVDDLIQRDGRGNDASDEAVSSALSSKDVEVESRVLRAVPPRPVSLWNGMHDFSPTLTPV
jgi:hypothetical protein